MHWAEHWRMKRVGALDERVKELLWKMDLLVKHLKGKNGC